MEMLWVYDQSMTMRCVLEHASKVSYTLKHNDLWVASFQLPAEDVKGQLIQAHDYVRIKDGLREVGLYRVISWSGSMMPDNEAMVTYQLEHVLATLLDDVLDGDHVVGSGTMDTAAVLRYILARQTVARWQLGTCDWSDHYEYVFSCQDLLTSLMSVAAPLVDDYTWVWDTTTTPWTISLKEADNTVSCGITYRRSLTSLERSVDATKLITRLIPRGYGEGVNQLTINSINGGLPYVDADNIDLSNPKVGIYTASDIEDASLLKAKGQQLVNMLSSPVVSYSATAADLSRMTGMDWDTVLPGRMCRVYDADAVLDMDVRIIEVSKSDAYGKPMDVTVVLSTASEDITGDINSLADRVNIHEVYSQGTTQMYPLQAQDNADAAHPLAMRYYVPDECRVINKVLLAWELEAFRAYETGAASGGGSTTTSGGGGGGTTSSSSGGEADVYTDEGSLEIISATVTGPKERPYPYDSMVSTREPNGWSTDPSTHTHIFDHDHDVTVEYTAPKQKVTLPAHTHSVTLSAHTHSVELPAHTHDLTFGIYEGDTASSVTIKVDGTTVPASAITGSQLDIAAYLSKGNDGKITRGAWHTVEIVPDKLSRIVGNLYMQIFIQNRGGGSY